MNARRRIEDVVNETMTRQDKASLHATCASCLEGLVEDVVLATHEEGAGRHLEAAQRFARVDEASKQSYSRLVRRFCGQRGISEGTSRASLPCLAART